MYLKYETIDIYIEIRNDRFCINYGVLRYNILFDKEFNEKQNL